MDRLCKTIIVMDALSKLLLYFTFSLFFFFSKLDGCVSTMLKSLFVYGVLGGENYVFLL